MPDFKKTKRKLSPKTLLEPQPCTETPVLVPPWTDTPLLLVLVAKNYYYFRTTYLILLIWPFKNFRLGWEGWGTPIIPATGEEDQSLRPSLGQKCETLSKKKKKKPKNGEHGSSSTAPA
jgi:hypothetical protein